MYAIINKYNFYYFIISSYIVMCHVEFDLKYLYKIVISNDFK